jgi:hypothetical protein
VTSRCRTGRGAGFILHLLAVLHLCHYRDNQRLDMEAQRKKREANMSHSPSLAANSTTGPSFLPKNQSRK